MTNSIAIFILGFAIGFALKSCQPNLFNENVKVTYPDKPYLTTPGSIKNLRQK